MGLGEGQIRSRREALGLSQQVLADQLGVHKSYLSLLENGKRPPTDDQAAQLSKILGVPAEILLLQAGRLPKDVQGAIATDAASVTTAVRLWAEQDAIVYPKTPEIIPPSKPPRQEMGATPERFIPPLIEVRKSSTTYRAHSYHTKVPPSAIRPFIEAFTEPGDLVSDPFCGSGMTGVAAVDAGRHALLSDLSPAAVHIARNYTAPCDPAQFEAALGRLEAAVQPTMDWLYTPIGKGASRVEYTVWSDIFACHACASKITYWAALHEGDGQELVCPQCTATLTKSNLVWVGEKPVQTHVSAAGRRMSHHTPTAAELALIEEVSATQIPYWTPSSAFGSDREMWRSAHAVMGITNAASFYTPRNLHALAALRHEIVSLAGGRVREALLFALTACVNRASKRYQWNAKRPTNVMTGTLYVSSLRYEWNVWSLFRRKARDVLRYYQGRSATLNRVQVFQASATDLNCIPDQAVDLVFMDPPFGSNIFYADSSLLWDAWLGAETDQTSEIVVNQRRPMAAGGKNLALYGDLMAQAFGEAARVMRRGGRGVLAFSNTDDRVWTEVQDALADAGLETRSVHVLNKGQPSIKGVKGQLGQERVTRLDLTLCLAHRSRPPRDRTAAPQAFVDASIQCALAEGVTQPDHLYTAVLRDVLQADLSATGITIQSIAARRSGLGTHTSPQVEVTDFVAGYLSDEALPKTQGSSAPLEPPVSRLVPGSRNTALYTAHSYHTKVPPEAITPFIEHFTKPGDVVLDPFCGSGMTGVSAALAGRRAILNDLSPAAAHLAWNHTRACDVDDLVKAFERIADAVNEQFNRLYATKDERGQSAKIRWTLWSTRHRCPNCRAEFLLWSTMDRRTGKLGRSTVCPTCQHEADRRRFEVTGNVPAWIAFQRKDGSRAERAATAEDIHQTHALAAEGAEMPFPDVPLGPDREMYQRCALHLQGVRSVRDMYTDRNRIALTYLWEAIVAEPDDRLRRALAFAFTNTAWHGTRMRRFNARGGHRPLTGTLYVPQLSAEANVLEVMRKKISQLRAYYKAFAPSGEAPRILTGSATDLSPIETASIDYVFTDPPFGSNIFYADCNLIWEAWLGRVTDLTLEAVVNRSLTIGNGGKTLEDYAGLMSASMTEIARVLKPGGWATVVFHNTDGEVWRALSEAASAAGFEFHEAASLDRKQQSHKGYKGRDGHEDVAHFDVVINLRKPENATVNAQDERKATDLRTLVRDARSRPEIAARGIQGIHAEVMRHLASRGHQYFPAFSEVRAAMEDVSA